jgi:hypothetical protein
LILTTPPRNSFVNPAIMWIQEMNIKVDKAPIHLVELNNYTCRWPLWADDIPRVALAPSLLYCGQTAERECPYCSTHMNIARRDRKLHND